MRFRGALGNLSFASRRGFLLWTVTDQAAIVTLVCLKILFVTRIEAT